MKKKLIGMLCGAAAVSMAVPALADVTVNGYFRTQGIVQNTSDNNTAGGSYVLNNKDNDAESFVVQRFRAKVTNKLNDLVSIVYFGEVDTDWGQADKMGTGGGRQGADGVNIETKNAYVDLKPSKDFPLSFRVGVQTIMDNIQYAFIADDAAAVVGMGTFGAANVAAGWSKFQEGGNNAAALAGEDDTDLYFVQVGFKATDTVKVGLDAYHVRMDETDAGANEDGVDLTTLAPYVKAMVGPVDLDAFLAYQFGKNKNGATDEDLSGLLISANGAMKLADNMTLGLRVIYYGNDDKADEDNSFYGNLGAFAFPNEGLNVFLSDLYKTNGGNDAAAIQIAEAGYGLLGGVLKFKADFAPMFVKCSLGYFQALKEEANDDGNEAEGKALGTEIAAEFGTKVGDIATLSLRGSYVMVGSFYDGSAAGGEDPDNAYMAALMLNVPY